MGSRIGGDDGALPIDPVLAHGKRRNRTHAVANLKVCDLWSDSVNDSCGLVPQPRGKLRRLQILTLSKHNFCAVKPDGLNLKADFSFVGFRQREVFKL